MRKKSKLICLILAVCITFITIHFFRTYKGGNVNNVKQTITKSEVYKDQDIYDAMDIAKKKFKRDFKGCVLTDLWYDENISSTKSAGWANQYNSDEAIVLLSNFDVGPSGGDGSLNPNTTYTNWQWILVRNNSNTNWELKTWGY